MRRGRLVVCAVLCLLPLTESGCRGKKVRSQSKLTEAQRSALSAFTHGPISRDSAIRVVFSEPRVDGSRLQAPLEPSPFRFDPAIKGTTMWTAPNQIEFRPEAHLPSGRPYAAWLDLDALLKDGPARLGRFEFAFEVVKQDFEVTVDGLEAADAADVKKQALTGKLVTADIEDTGKVEALLFASLAGGPHLPVDWTHDPERRVHAFRVRDIVRKEAPGALRVQWDGAGIGVDKKDGRDVTVPGLNNFAVDQVRGVQEKESYIELRFTDPLQKKQSLQGLITVDGRDDLRFTVNGSTVQVFGAKGWSGHQVVRVNAGIRNSAGFRLRETKALDAEFEVLKPQVRFVGKGAIVPSSTGLKVPLETVNVRSVIVEALRIADSNLPQFFQVNDFGGEQELHRVGRVVWKDVVPLNLTPDKENRWMSVALDLTPLVEKSPGGLYRLSLSFKRPHVLWTCDGKAVPEVRELPAPDVDGENEESNWDEVERLEGEWENAYEHRDDPCHPAYYVRYYDHDVRASRNVLVSDLGLLAKRGEDETVTVVSTDLRTSEPLSGTEITLRGYQHQDVGSARTDSGGVARVTVTDKPFLLEAKRGGQKGYLRLDDGSALSTAHFDVGGARAPKGLKGFLYGERGVWRPGDTLHLSFILFDPVRRLPGQHPVRFDLLDTRGKPVQTLTRTASTDGFYTFAVATSPDAPTGNYTGRVSVGGATFERVLKIETIQPNRLKIGLTFEKAELESGDAVSGTLTSAWLHGGSAKGLKADVEMSLQSAATRFERYGEYVFDDPTRKFDTETQKLFEGHLDATGTTHISAAVAAGAESPGKLVAHFTTRVFEPGGAFSIDRFQMPFSPYDRYIGIRAPKGDRVRGMLLTDTKHTVDIVAVDAKGQPAGDGEVALKLYKVDWRWWWERGDGDLSAFAESSVHTPIQSGTAKLSAGVGTWTFDIKYPEWGRYLLLADDAQGSHRTGKVLYIDWPGWAGRGQKEGAGGASVLGFAADRPEYAVGDTVTLTIPTPKQGRALVSLESGTRVLKTDWLEAKGTETRYTFKAAPEMAPNIYAHVTLLQPHARTGNDLPIRMYGVALVKVVDKDTRLAPVIEAPEVFAPEGTRTLSVRESAGRAMTYTVAIVDEGLLSLTRYNTPNPWDHFYAREALAVRTWDLYDHVVGAYGAAFDRMLAIGGDEAGATGPAKRANRFPPMVRFLGPFTLAAGATNAHSVDVPQYVGAVRLMVVAGKDGAFGAAEKSVFVRKPLMILGTLPRVLGPEETVSLPVSVFALEDKVKDVTVSVTTSGPLQVVGDASRKVSFKEVGDQLVSFQLSTSPRRGPSSKSEEGLPDERKTRPTLGVAKVVIRAVSGAERAEQKVELDVRTSAVRVVDVVGGSIEPQKTWQPAVTLPGLIGTNQAVLEVSRVPPIDLGRRLEYLITYPHGCLEQTTSSVFPQLYLGKLIELTPNQKARIETHIKAGIEKLKPFQTPEGGFGYWPGSGDPDDWSSTYAGHFLVEAQKAGYVVPPSLIDPWKTFERRRARAWVAGAGRAELIQAYRLFALALAGAPELGAMNQLREREKLPVTVKWRLAAAYQLAGQPEAARASMTQGAITVEPYRELSWTYGSDLRDRAMILEALVLLKAWDRVGALVQSVSNTLTQSTWLSTQETSYALLALARAAGDGKKEPVGFTYTWNGGKEETVSSMSAIVQRPLTVGDKAPGLVLRNTGGSVLYPRLILSGLPAVGQETAASNGLTLTVDYLTPDDKPMDPTRLEQGTDFKARVKLTNSGVRGDLQEIALSHLAASGWEIHNDRMDTVQQRAASPFDFQDIRDDRVYTYLDLKAGESKTMELRLNASYLGRYYLPLLSAEAMYDATLNARAKGRWVEVVEPGRE